MAEKRPVKITETILRDAHQSLIATRMPTEEMLPIIDSAHLRSATETAKISFLIGRAIP